ncbi:unnamed protein product [Ilex paraguariensis]|uniref:Uncharacterized protein n=1 Tax=Ilex paraguariensis TaxID=185542 RepID=A0ABC8SF27_9AQUA
MFISFVFVCLCSKWSFFMTVYFEISWSNENVCLAKLVADMRRKCKFSLLPSLKRGVIVCASDSNPAESDSYRQENTSVRINGGNGVESFCGKSGSISFAGVTHQLVEESKLVLAPSAEGTGSFLWAWAPIALISSLVLPQLFVGAAIDGFFGDEIFSEIVASFASDIFFYIGLATFLFVTDRVQKPYLQFSPKRWGLITGLKGYLTSAFFTMGFKVFAPLVAIFVTWPVLGLPALVSVAPLLVGYLAQYVFEKLLDKQGSSCWPLVPIIFEVYRLYQLSKATHFIEKLMFAMRGATLSPEVLERNGALVAMIVTFQVLGVICLWSLLTFLQRLFPSRPVAEKY